MAAARRLLRRIEERDVAVEDQVALVGLAVGRRVARRPCRAARRPWWRWPARGSRRRSAARTPSSAPRCAGGPSGRACRRARSSRTCGKIASGAPLEMMRSLPSGVRTTTDMMRRWKSKGISSTFASSGTRACAWRLLVREDGAVEDVLEARLEVAVEVGEREHAVVLAQRHVAVPLEDDLVHASACRSCRCRARPSRRGSGWR